MQKLVPQRGKLEPFTENQISISSFIIKRKGVYEEAVTMINVRE